MTGCEVLIGVVLFSCLARNPACLPPEYAHLRDDLAAIARQESGFKPLAIRDETTRESLFPATHADAVRMAAERDAAGHTLGLGLYQITHRSNWRRHGLSIASALDGCANMRAGAAHYAGNLAQALAVLRPPALQAYNSGRLDGAPAYAAAVVARLQNVQVRAGGVAAPVDATPAPVPAPVPRPPAQVVDLILRLPPQPRILETASR